MIRVLVDANVIYSNDLRNLFMSLAWLAVIELRWTPEIEGEWVRNREQVLANSGRASDGPKRVAERMRTALPNWQTPNYSEFLVECGSTHPKDMHVAAAALSVAPCCLVTLNLADFDGEGLGRRGVRVVGPDDFLTDLLNVDPSGVRHGVAAAAGFARVSGPGEYLDRFLLRLPRFHAAAHRSISWPEGGAG